MCERERATCFVCTHDSKKEKNCSQTANPDKTHYFLLQSTATREEWTRKTKSREPHLRHCVTHRVLRLHILVCFWLSRSQGWTPLLNVGESRIFFLYFLSFWWRTQKDNTDHTQDAHHSSVIDPQMLFFQRLNKHTSQLLSLFKALNLFLTIVLFSLSWSKWSSPSTSMPCHSFLPPWPQPPYRPIVAYKLVF